MTKMNIPEPTTTQKLIEPAANTLVGILDWDQLDRIWQIITQHSDAKWYWYELDKPMTDTPVTASELQSSIESLDRYLHQSHRHDYCGIVYVDSLDKPSLIRVFDPATLLSMCNINGYVTPPGWVITTMNPTELTAQQSDQNGQLAAAPKTSGAHQTLDARRMGCPLPLVHTSRALKGLEIDEVLEVITREPGSINDIEAICSWTDQKHIALAEGDYGYSFFVQRKKFRHAPKSLKRN